MVGISASRIEKIEYELQEPTLYDIVQMADCYKRPDLCNYYCSHRCAIGDRYVPEVEVSELSNIILETIASLNEINPLTRRLIQIARDGKIPDDEIKDFAFISKKLDEVSLAIDSLNLWVDKTASENNINISLLNAEKKRSNKQQKQAELSFFGQFCLCFITLLLMFSTAPPSPASPTASSKAPDPTPELNPLLSPALFPNPLSSENKTSLQISAHSSYDRHL